MTIKMAVSKPIGDVIAEELECSICLDRLESPRMLTCHHSFCEHCLEGFANLNLDGFINCPTCRERTAIPNVGITGLKPDFRANKLLQALKKDRTSKQGATVQQSCSSESVSVEKNVVIRKCPRHDERFKFYCKTCSICICADCTVLDHSKVDGHECVYLKEIVEQQRRDVAKLVTQVDEKAKDLDSFLSKIVATKQILDQKSSDIAQEIEIEIAKSKTMLLEQSKDYVEKDRHDINDIEQRNRSAKAVVEEVARVLHQVSSSKDDLEVAGMHHNLLESVRKMTGIESDATTLDNLQTKFKTLTLKCVQNSSSHHSSINLVEQKRVVEQQNVPHATKYYAVGKKDNGTLSVVYATSNGQMSCHNVQKESRPEKQAVQQNLHFPANRMGMNSMVEEYPKPDVYYGDYGGPATYGGVYDNYGSYPSQAIPATTYGATAISSEVGQRCFPSSDKTCRPYDILPNGQICCLEGGKLLKGSMSITLNTSRYPQQREHRRHTIYQGYQGYAMAVSTKGYVYVATAGLDCLIQIAPNNVVSPSHGPIGYMIPFAISTCNTSSCDTLLIASKPASVSLIGGQPNIRRIFSDREGVVWENAALTCSHEGRVYLLSSQDSKITLRILDKEGNLHETIFRDRPLSLQKPPSQPRMDPFSAQFQFRPPARQSTSPTSSAANQQRLAPRLSIAVASNGDIAAVLDENELVLITLEKVDVCKA